MQDNASLFAPSREAEDLFVAASLSEHLAMLKINQKRKLGYHGGLFDPYVGKGNSTRNWKREERKAYPSKGYRGY